MGKRSLLPRTAFSSFFILFFLKALLFPIFWRENNDITYRAIIVLLVALKLESGSWGWRQSHWKRILELTALLMGIHTRTASSFVWSNTIRSFESSRLRNKIQKLLPFSPHRKFFNFGNLANQKGKVRVTSEIFIRKWTGFVEDTQVCPKRIRAKEKGNWVALEDQLKITINFGVQLHAGCGGGISRCWQSAQ